MDREICQRRQNGDRLADVGVAEVARQAETEDHADGNGHERVAAEVEIDLQGVGHGAGPGGHRVQGLAGQGEHPVRHCAQVVGNERLLGQADDEQAQAEADAAGGDAPPHQRLGNGVVADDRSGHHVREHGDVQADVERRGRVGGHPAVHVHQVGDAVEGEVGDAQRQVRLAYLTQAHAEQVRQHLGQRKGEVLVIKKQA